MLQLQKRIIIIVLLTLALIISAIIFSLFSSKPTQNPNLPIPTPTPFPLATPNPRAGLPIYSEETLHNLAGVAAIPIRLPQAVARNTISYTIEPPVATTSELNTTGTVFTIKPVDFWVVDTKYRLEVTSPLGKSVFTFTARMDIDEGGSKGPR